VLDTRVHRTLAHFDEESFEPLGIALGDHFDAAVRNVAHFAVHSVLARATQYERAVADTLDAAVNHGMEE
jgi:hypothetical protein